MKRYAQACSIARSLDVVGERWNLLLVREMLLGPRRHRDLAAGVPGIPSNVLAARLTSLQDAGVVVRRTLPAPTDVTVYELTEAGWALRPVLRELMAWGRRFAPESEPDDVVQPSWAMLSVIGRPSALPEGQTCELRIADEVFYVGSAGGKTTVRRGPAPAGDAAVTLSADALYGVVTGEMTTTRALADSTVDGDPRIAGLALAPFARAGFLEDATAG